jgi:hypothetical protein
MFGKYNNYGAFFCVVSNLGEITIGENSDALFVIIQESSKEEEWRY